MSQKKKSSELRAELKAKLTDAEMVERIVKGEIASGNCEDDGARGVLAGIPVDLIAKSAKELDDAMNVTPPKADPIAKSGNDDSLLGRVADVEAIAKSAAGSIESVIDYQRDVFPVLVKSQAANGKVLQGVVDALGFVFNTLDEIKKSIRHPHPPAGVTAEGGSALAHPSEQPDGIAKGSASAKAPSAKVSFISAKALKDQLTAYREDLIQKGASANEKEILKAGSAIAALEAGESTDRVVSRFAITFAPQKAAANG